MQQSDAEWTGDAPLAGSEPAKWLISLYFAALVLWVGGAVFMSAGVLPTLFNNLEPADAGRIAALVFPLYFRGGFALGFVASGAAFALARTRRTWRPVLALLVCMTAAEGWSAVVVHPEMARLRGVAAEVARFQSLHLLSVRLNGVVLVGGLLLVAATGSLFELRRGRS